MADYPKHPQSAARPWGGARYRFRPPAPFLVALLAFALFLSTLQWDINGSASPYATDVGELQNALPRWGTIHFTGYPVYMMTGSAFVTGLRWMGVPPAAGASLLSAVWGAVAIALLARLGMELGSPTELAAPAALLTGVSTATLIDASLAEIHTMTMALTAASLLLAVRFGQSGKRRDFLWLVLIYTQGLAHQRAMLFMAPGLLILCGHRWRVAWENALPAIGLALLAPLTYVYLPLREWMGADWTFGQTGTWRGFWTMILDTKAERIIAVPSSLSELATRLRTTAVLLHEDLPLPMITLGLLGTLAPWMRGQRRLALGIATTALAYLALCLVIWEGRVSDALLAAKLPVTHLACVGVGLLLAHVSQSRKGIRLASAAILAMALILLVPSHRSTTLEITRDPSARRTIALVQEVASPQEPTTFMALWGNDYWALAYAQAFEGQLSGLNLVDHNAHFEAIVARGDRLLTLQRTLYALPPDWWEARLGPLHLTSMAPEILALSPEPLLRPEDVPAGPTLDLGNGITLWAAQATQEASSDLHVTVYWRATERPTADYAVAAHLLAHQPPQSSEDVLAQADTQHPVYGWYPTSRWQDGEIVRDDLTLTIPSGADPVAVRLGMYRQAKDGSFVNSPWFVIPSEEWEETR
ncbi:MAG: hypothetical protein ACP5G7_10575 [Anaerolineae bacterium]